MAEYTSRHTGLQIDDAIDSALNVKQVRGIVKMTDAGPVAAVPDEDFIADSGSIVSVTGLLKGVRNAETNEIEVQQATAGTDYQPPLTAGADYATPSAVANKQNKITAQGLLKGLGEGSVAAAEAGVDYITPEQAKTFLVTMTIADNGTITVDKTVQEIIAAYEAGRMVFCVWPGTGYIFQLSVVDSDILHVEFAWYDRKYRRMIELSGGKNEDFGDFWSFLVGEHLAVVPAQLTALPASGTALTANTIYAVADAVGTYAFTPPESGWAHGTFTTGASVSVSFSGTFMGAAPTIEASKTYEFDVLDGVWAVQEVVSA